MHYPCRFSFIQVILIHKGPAKGQLDCLKQQRLFTPHLKGFWSREKSKDYACLKPANNPPPPSLHPRLSRGELMITFFYFRFFLIPGKVVMAFSWELADHRFQSCALSFYMSSGIILGSGCVKSPLLCLCVVQLSISLCCLSPLMQPSRAVPKSIGETLTDHSFIPAFRPSNWLLLKQVTDILSSVQGKESG